MSKPDWPTPIIGRKIERAEENLKELLSTTNPPTHHFRREDESPEDYQRLLDKAHTENDELMSNLPAPNPSPKDPTPYAGMSDDKLGRPMTEKERISMLEALISEYEFALQGAVWATEPEMRDVQSALNVSGHEARLLILLYKSKRALSKRELTMALPTVKDTTERTSPNISSVYLTRMRKRFGADIFESFTWRGIRLTEAGRTLVAGALGK